jgi:hypothetical protein
MSRFLARRSFEQKRFSFFSFEDEKAKWKMARANKVQSSEAITQTP